MLWIEFKFCCVWFHHSLYGFGALEVKGHLCLRAMHSPDSANAYNNTTSLLHILRNIVVRTRGSLSITITLCSKLSRASWKINIRLTSLTTQTRLSSLFSRFWFFPNEKLHISPLDRNYIKLHKIGNTPEFFHCNRSTTLSLRASWTMSGTFTVRRPPRTLLMTWPCTGKPP